MRPVRLAQIAAQAEGLRLRRRLRRVITQVVLALLALPFLLATLGFLEAAFWNFVADHVPAPLAAVLVAVGNLLVAVVLLGMAMMRGGEDRVSLEALEVRRRALDSAQRGITVATLMGPVAGFLLNQLRRPRSRRR